jgi:hypothetical protein
MVYSHVSIWNNITMQDVALAHRRAANGRLVVTLCVAHKIAETPIVAPTAMAAVGGLR